MSRKQCKWRLSPSFTRATMGSDIAISARERAWAVTGSFMKTAAFSSRQEVKRKKSARSCWQRRKEQNRVHRCAAAWILSSAVCRMPTAAVLSPNQRRYPCVSPRIEQWGNSQNWGLTADPCHEKHRPQRGWGGFEAHLLPTPAPSRQRAGSPPGPVCPLGRYFAEFGMLICGDKGEAVCYSSIESSAREMSNLTILLRPWEKNVTVSVSLYLI